MYHLRITALLATFFSLGSLLPVLAVAPRPASLISEFGQAGVLNLSGYSDMSMALQSDDKILLAGTRGEGEDARLELVRFLSSGKLDVSFGQNGVVATGLVPLRAVKGNQILLVSNEKRILLGHSEGVARFNLDGGRDAEWGRGGLAETKGVFRIGEQPDGRLVTLAVPEGNYALPAVLSRFTKEGQRDESFTPIVLDGPDELQAPRIWLRVSPFDGSLAVHGWAVEGGRGIIWRFDRDGKLDTRFGKGGHFNWRGGGEISRIGGVSFDRDGLVVAARGNALGRTPVTRTEKEEASQDLALFRLDTRGRITSGFGSGLEKPFDFGGIEDPTSIVRCPDGTYLVVVEHIPDGRDPDATHRFITEGLGRQQNLLLHFDARGRVDMNFSDGSKPVTVPSVLLVGAQVGVLKSGRIVCLSADGKLDNAMQPAIERHQLRCYKGFLPSAPAKKATNHRKTPS